MQVGVNISKPQVERAREFARERLTHSSVEFHHRDYTNLQMPGETVDGVYGIESICHAPNKLSFYKQAQSILKAGGKLVVIDYFMESAPIIDADSKNLNVFQAGWQIADCHENYLEELTLAGFENIQLKDITREVEKGIFRSHLNAIEKMEVQSSNYSKVMIKHLEACIALQHLVSRNILSYGVLTASKA